MFVFAFSSIHSAPLNLTSTHMIKLQPPYLQCLAHNKCSMKVCWLKEWWWTWDSNSGLPQGLVLLPLSLFSQKQVVEAESNRGKVTRGAGCEPSKEEVGHVYGKNQSSFKWLTTGGGGRHSPREHSGGWGDPWGSVWHPWTLKTNGSNPWTASEVEGSQRAGCPRWVKQAYPGLRKFPSDPPGCDLPTGGSWLWISAPHGCSFLLQDKQIIISK